MSAAATSPFRQGEEHVERARALFDLARECGDEAERERRLPKRLVDAMCAAGLYRMAAPAAIGGGETDPLTQIEVIEALSRADGAAGWTLMIGIENMGFLGAALAREPAREIYADSGLVVAGALNPLGRARAVPGGYRVTGQWPFASGCEAAQYFWGQCIVLPEGQSEPEPGAPLVLREALIPAAEFEVVDTWQVAGLRGSGSHDVRAADVRIPEERMTAVMQRPLYETGPLFRLPVFSRLAYNKVGVATGIARAALDHFVDLAVHKIPRGSRRALRERPDAQIALAEAEAELRSARAWVFEVVGEMWSHTLAGREIGREEQTLVQLACTHAVSAAARAVEKVHAAAGASANFTASPLERCFRDVHVVGQHIMVSPQWVRQSGRMLLGLPGDIGR